MKKWCIEDVVSDAAQDAIILRSLAWVIVESDEKKTRKAAKIMYRYYGGKLDEQGEPTENIWG